MMAGERAAKKGRKQDDGARGGWDMGENSNAHMFMDDGERGREKDC